MAPRTSRQSLILLEAVRIGDLFRTSSRPSLRTLLDRNRCRLVADPTDGAARDRILDDSESLCIFAFLEAEVL